MYFSYLTSADAATAGDDTAYECKVTIGRLGDELVNKVYLSVIASEDNNTKISLQYPTTPSERKVKCIEGDECRLTVIYGGTYVLICSPFAFAYHTV